MTEIPLKLWKMQEAERRRTSLQYVENCLSAKRIPYPKKLRRVNSRIIFVQVHEKEAA